MEHRKQEEVLKRFRIHECNLLISTSILEHGIEIPKCNLVLRYDFPINYQSYVQCKSRARAIDALHVLLIPAAESKQRLVQLAQYHYIEKVLYYYLGYYEKIVDRKKLKFWLQNWTVFSTWISKKREFLSLFIF